MTSKSAKSPVMAIQRAIWRLVTRRNNVVLVNGWWFNQVVIPSAKPLMSMIPLKGIKIFKGLKYITTRKTREKKLKVSWKGRILDSPMRGA